MQYSIQDYREKLYQDILKRRKQLRRAEKEKAAAGGGRVHSRARSSSDILQQPKFR